MKLPLPDQIRLAGLPEPQLEYKFHPTRDWRFDLAWPAWGWHCPVHFRPGLAVEVEGGVFTQGRHTRGHGYTEDCHKYSEAALLGWVVARVTTQMVTSGEAVNTVARALKILRTGVYESPLDLKVKRRKRRMF